MKVQQIFYSILLAVLVLPVTAGAQIYKWKDKNGVMRYSDMPPPPNVEVETIGKSAKDPYAKPKAIEAADSVKNSEAGAVAPPDKKDQIVDPSADPKLQQVKKAELERQNKLEQEKQAKIDAENCSAARANYQTYLQGGRVYKINEKGERVFMGNEDLEAGKAKAQAEINQYCK